MTLITKTNLLRLQILRVMYLCELKMSYLADLHIIFLLYVVSKYENM